MKKVQFVPCNYYHVYNRGVNRGSIFYSRSNYIFFLKKLNQYFAQDLAEVIVYCLMPNHYHLLVRTFVEDFGRKIMQPLTISYTKSINKEQARVGHLFQGKFQAKHIDSDRYLTHLSRYIHRNPVAANLVAAPEQWEFSSYQDYSGIRAGRLPNPEPILSQFESIDNYVSYVTGEDSNQNQTPIKYLLD